MPITRRLVAQNQEENQILKVDSLKRYVVNDEEYWQFLFGPNSALTQSQQVVKLAAEFDTTDLSSVRFTGYLYNPRTGGVDSAATCLFSVYLVSAPEWSETLVGTFSGAVQSNNYFFSDIDLTSLVPAELDGDATLMIEARITRLSETFRDRVYVNHLGVYDSIVRLRNDVEFLDVTKLDE